MKWDIRAVLAGKSKDDWLVTQHTKGAVNGVQFPHPPPKIILKKVLTNRPPSAIIIVPKGKGNKTYEPLRQSKTGICSYGYRSQGQGYLL
jgi:hypothetical protein